MRIQKTDFICDVPAPAARELARLFSQWEGEAEASRDLLAKFGITTPERVVADFVEAGYLRRAAVSRGSDELWTTTIKGNALAMASFGRPISRATADRLLRELLERTHRMNADSERLFSVQRLRVFGSYVDAEIDPLGDVDIEVVLLQRVPHEVILAYGQKSGKRFGTFLQQMFWAQTEFLQDLRNKSTALNLTTEDASLFTDQFETIYELDRDDAAVKPGPEWSVRT